MRESSRRGKDRTADAARREGGACLLSHPPQPPPPLSSSSCVVQPRNNLIKEKCNHVVRATAVAVTHEFALVSSLCIPQVSAHREFLRRFDKDGKPPDRAEEESEAAYLQVCRWIG